ncbi:VOC family protein [Rhodococcus sp. DT1]|uniref:VOC family protein n=1 Tax=Rhodococcus sp. DT1 TaxID=3416544 RepID=UPI003CF28143
MPAPNLFLVYVRDAAAATAFYRNLFDIEPVFVSPRYVAFGVAPGVEFALWSGRSDHATPGTPRTSEIGLTVPGPASEVDEIFSRWSATGAEVVEKPHDDVFGRTFVIADPDGNLIRVAPVDG